MFCVVFNFVLYSCFGLFRFSIQANYLAWVDLSISIGIFLLDFALILRYFTYSYMAITGICHHFLHSDLFRVDADDTETHRMVSVITLSTLNKSKS